MYKDPSQSVEGLYVISKLPTRRTGKALGTPSLCCLPQVACLEMRQNGYWSCNILRRSRQNFSNLNWTFFGPTYSFGPTCLFDVADRRFNNEELNCQTGVRRC